MIMERRLLAQNGIIVADNVLSQGCTVDSAVNPHTDSAIKNGAELRKFNRHIKEVHSCNPNVIPRLVQYLPTETDIQDDRVDVCVLPMFDGLALIKWKPHKYPLQRVSSHLSINNYSVANGSRPRSIHRTSFELHSQRSPSRNSHDLSRTGTPSFIASQQHHRLSDEEIDEKDEFSYGFSNRRNSHDEDEETGRSPTGAFAKKLEDFNKGRASHQLVHPVGSYDARNQYYD